MTDRIWKKRFAVSIAVVIALIGSVPIADAFIPDDADENAANRLQTGINSQDLLKSSDPFDAIERIEQAATPGNAQLPEAFASEVGLPDECRQVRVDETGCVIGCAVDAGADEAAELIERQMLEKGWKSIALGAVTGSTYVKEDGRCAWVLATCTEVGNCTQIVYRCVYR